MTADSRTDGLPLEGLHACARGGLVALQSILKGTRASQADENLPARGYLLEGSGAAPVPATPGYVEAAPRGGPFVREVAAASPIGHGAGALGVPLVVCMVRLRR